MAPKMTMSTSLKDEKDGERQNNCQSVKKRRRKGQVTKEKGKKDMKRVDGEGEKEGGKKETEFTLRKRK